MFIYHILAALPAIVLASSYPGLILKASENGVQTALDFADSMLQQIVRNATENIPDYKNHIKFIEYDFYRIKMPKLEIPKFKGELAQPSMVVLKTTGGTAVASADMMLAISVLELSGEVEVTASELDITATTEIFKSYENKLQLKMTQCNINVGKLDYTYSGFIQKLINKIGHSTVTKILVDLIENTVCTVIQGAVSQYVDNVIPNSIKIDPFQLDISELLEPTVQDKILNLGIDGTVFPASQSTHPKSDPEPVDSTVMNKTGALYVWATEHVANSAIKTAADVGLIHINVTRDMVPKQFKTEFNTSCPGILKICLGKTIPEIGKAYPDKYLAISVMPKVGDTFQWVNFTKDKISLDAVVTMLFYIDDAAKEPLFYVDIVLGADVNLAFENYTIKGGLSIRDVTGDVTKSYIGDITGLKGLIGLVHIAAQVIGNMLLQKGIPIPVQNYVSDIQVYFVENAGRLEINFRN